jgi:ATP-binding cassette subfamily C exporter for protease/lipase
MVLRLPQGYDTQLGDDGSGLAGGQKQRLGLARALYGDPSLIVLDEPNSNLDETGELALTAAISDLRSRDKTIVMITHRQSILQTTTKLLLLREGMAQLFGPSAQVIRELTMAQKQQQVENAKQASA